MPFATKALFASAARTASHQSEDQLNRGHRGVRVVINATASAATPSVVFTIQAKDVTSNTYQTVLASAAVTGTGTTVLKVYPGITAAANASVSDVLAPIWRLDVAHGDADSLTYSVGVDLLP